MKMKSHKVHISEELSELSRMCWMDVGCVSDQIADVALRRSSQWPALCQNVDALCGCVGSQSACERLHPGAPRLCWDCSHLHIYFTGNPCASVNSPGSVKFESLTGIEAPAETPCQSWASFKILKELWQHVCEQVAKRVANGTIGLRFIKMM